LATRRTTFEKLRKERARREKQLDKAARRERRKAEGANRAEGADEVAQDQDQDGNDESTAEPPPTTQSPEANPTEGKSD
jgi:hypothetical protein